MNIDRISPSILHVTAKENLNIQDDLARESTKTIAELIDEKETKTEESSTNSGRE